MSYALRLKQKFGIQIWPPPAKVPASAKGAAKAIYFFLMVNGSTEPEGSENTAPAT